MGNPAAPFTTWVLTSKRLFPILRKTYISPNFSLLLLPIGCIMYGARHFLTLNPGIPDSLVCIGFGSRIFVCYILTVTFLKSNVLSLLKFSFHDFSTLRPERSKYNIIIIDLDVKNVPFSVAANERREFMEILDCDWLPPDVGQDWRRGIIVGILLRLLFNP